LEEVVMKAAHLFANTQANASCGWTYLRAFCVQMGQRGDENTRVELPQTLDLMVGVAGFEPASRTYRPDPYSSQFQILSTTADDWATELFAPFEPLAFKLRARAGSAVAAIAAVADPSGAATQSLHGLREGGQ
jgi:hypothetical protein